MPANGKLPGRFELPQLKPLNFSLTDGTDIPPPPDSPIEEQPQHVPVSKETAAATTLPAPGSLTSMTTNGQSSPDTHKDSGDGMYDGRRQTNYNIETPPMSPASTKPGSVRRFLPRKELNANYADGMDDSNASHEDLVSIKRPESAMSFASQRPSLAKKKSGSWFKRLGGSSRRTSVIYEDKKTSMQRQPAIYEDEKTILQPQSAPVTRKGPPPPKLPELMTRDDGGSLGEDMFKNIK
ncbi:uncharacterized protein L3040_008335 [Drepanopeziza brunnea f. sp. 'multigermtubi']|uniref:Uncharacterized protein n=2 Tax=Drepanopeziza brunnea f. sp. 'multigermtubi' TaxID=698441 RepID=K1X0B0_MARBU|nr:uncharacterized protein MBM_07543 [Drepanopeziza brunnea f. sp. 'multigermtubi' MB_m1]EKD14313.1 hypothetical protein MBM_07543 [Drepanopeziza brunnea f. sp. 'multigermtubi' MB_m1]KAJ5035073.1 hypothetical protein L3040_008335 [Drepanopeziza brunnea f. sp. 'multigermtubi']